MKFQCFIEKKPFFYRFFCFVHIKVWYLCEKIGILIEAQKDCFYF